MSGVIPLSAVWLTLREEADARSRSWTLAGRAAQLVRPPLVVHDLAGGTGSMMRWLAPLLPGPQTWVLHDGNPLLLDRSVEGASDSSGHEVAVRIDSQDVADLREGDFAGASLVTTSALLDVLTREELESVVRACVAAGAPALFTLSVTGGVLLDPVDAGDGVFAAAFNDHQRRTTRGRHLLGPDAVATASALFRSAGWSVEVADSPWRLDASDHGLADAWLDGWVGAAVEDRPALQEWAGEYLRNRAAQLADGVLDIVVDHRDLFAWPP